MDASMQTRLRQKQANQWLNRNKPQDAGTITWINKLQASSYIAPHNNAYPSVSSNGNPIINCTTCTLSTSTPPTEMITSRLSFGGSAAKVYSSDPITYKSANSAVCACDGGTPIPIMTATSNNFIFQNTAAEGWNYDISGNPGKLQKQYLPDFDPYWQLKVPCFPTTDLNARQPTTLDPSVCNGTTINNVVRATNGSIVSNLIVGKFYSTYPQGNIPSKNPNYLV